MDRRSNDDVAPPRSELRELRVDITSGTDWFGTPSPRRVNTAPNSPSTAFRTDRETIFRSGRGTVAETHLIRSTGSQSESFTEEHWSSEITSFVTAAPPKFIQVIKAYRVLSTDTPTLVVEVASDPPAIFEWFCNDKSVQQDRRRFQARHGLNITTLTVHEPEQGVYKCTARNPAGTSTSYGYITVNFENQYNGWTIVDRSMATEEGQTSVTVQRAPRFVHQVPNLTIQPGSEAVIDVEVEADPPARFSWFVNGREFRESSNGVEIFSPSTNRCIVKFAFPVSGEYKVVASNIHGTAVSSGYIEIHRAKPSKQMRPPIAAGEHLSRNIMATSHHAGAMASSRTPDGQVMVPTHQMVNVYEVNYTQRASSVPRGVRHLESHIEVPTSPTRRVFLEQHRAELGKKLPDRLPRSLYKTRSEGARSLPHAPKFTTTLPPEMTVNPNEELVLSVEVSAIPTAKFKWDVNGFEVKPSRNITLVEEENRSTLTVQPPVKQGKYNVVASNTEGRESQLTRVFHETHVIQEAQAAEISIDTDKSHHEIQMESAVTVTRTNETDWEMLDSVDSSVSTTTFQTVTEKKPPEIIKEEVLKTETTIEEGKTNVNEVAIERAIVQKENFEEKTTKTSFVKARSVPRSQDNIPKRPVILSEPWQGIHLKAGEPLLLEVKVDSSPPATFRWYVNNFEAKNGQYISITQPEENVSVATFSKPSAGHYKVVAANPLGEVTAVTRVTTETVVEKVNERTTVTTTAAEKPAMFTLAKKPIITVREDLPKPPRIVEKLPPLLKMKSTEPISLRVRADSVPEATFMWLLNNFEMKKSQNVNIVRVESNVSELHLQKVQAGKYDVVARNRLGQDSSSCKVILEYEQAEPVSRPKPFFTQPLSEDTTTYSNEETKLEVIITGSSPFSFKWLINGVEIKSSRDFEITAERNRSSLVLRKSVGNDSIVAVEVRDRNGSARSQTTIKEVLKTTAVVKEQPTATSNKAPVFVIRLDNIELLEGDALRCHAKVSDESDTCTFEWYANDMPITSGDQVIVESGSRESRLTIENMGEMSDVQVTVVARNQHGSSVSSAKLNVARRPDDSFEMVSADVPEESAPKIIEPLHSASFIDGQPMLLRCRIKAVPSAVVVWSKDDINLDEWVINKDIITRVLPDGICELMNPEVYPEDTGLYKCTATNPHGTAETAAYINIGRITYARDREDGSISATSPIPEELNQPPKFLEPLTAETDGAYELNYIRLICRIQSAVRTTVTWWKDGVELVSSDKYELHEFSDGALILTIHSPTSGDNGIYTCKAESVHGMSSSSCEVVVPTRTITTERITESHTETITLEPTAHHVIETEKENYVATTEITKHEEEYRLLVKVAESVASTLVANIFVDAVREAVKKIMEEESEEEEIIESNAPRFETCIERYVVKENDSVTISTVVTGDPTPFIEWYFKDQKLCVTEKISMGYEGRIATLILKNVTFAQEGTYYCHAINPHGTTVFSSEVKVLPEKAGDTVRLTLAKYDKQEGSESLITNIFAHHTDEHYEQGVGVKEPIKASASSGYWSATPTVVKKAVEVFETVADSEQLTAKPAVSLRPAEQAPVSQPEEEKTVEQPPPTTTSPGEPPVAAPRKRKEEKAAKVSTQREVTKVEEETQTVEESEAQVRLIAIRFADSLAEDVMSQAESSLRSSVQSDVNAVPKKIVEKRHEEEKTMVTKTVETTPTSSTIVVAQKLTADAPTATMTVIPQTSTILTKAARSLEELINSGLTTIDVRKPNVQFDHVVTVVEPEVVQLGLRLQTPNVPSMKFIDLDTILQRPSTSSSANTLITSSHRGEANAEHRIVVIEGASQKFQQAMTLSLKKVRKLATESLEPSAFVQIEVLKPTEASEQVLTIVTAEKLIPDLVRVAAAASKLKMENVTVSLVRHGDTAHQELVIEYESHIEDAVGFNLSQLVCGRHSKEESQREEVWSRRSRYSGLEENVVAVFMEVDANCPDQCVEIVASVSMPLEFKLAPVRTPSPEIMEVSESLTESSSALGQQAPRFVRTLQDCQTTIGRSAQFKCIVSSMPPPEVSWYVDGDIIQSCQEYEIVFEDGVCILRINEALAEDEGEYTCEAKNSAGKAVTKCYLKVLNEPQPPIRFIEHAPSLTELIDHAEDPFDSFEFEENKANRLFTSDNESKRSSITYNSEFDLSRIVNYNEDMEETNAFHRYFDTFHTTARVMIRMQREHLYASLVSEARESAQIDLVITKPASYSSVVHLVPIPAFHDTESKILKIRDSLRRTLNNLAPEKKLKEVYEPREPELPQKMYYKGQEIAVSVNEVEKEEFIVNENGSVEVSRKTCMETFFEFGTELDITQSIRTICNALPDQSDGLDHLLKNYSEVQPKENNISLENDLNVAKAAPYAEKTIQEKMNELERARTQSLRAKPRPLANSRKSVSEGAAQLESSMFDPDFLSKMREIERIARQVDEELGQLSSPIPAAPSDSDAKEIEEAIFKISDQLLLAQPITEAQAEANEELLRTTLADMILNPTRTAEEEIELLKRPIRLLRRKLSDLENSLMEDAEVMAITVQPCAASEAAILTNETPPIMRSQNGSRPRIPSAEYLRVTPLTSNIKDQLSSLEEMITVHMGCEIPDSTDDEDAPLLGKSSSRKKRELHDLFIQINHEINTIKTYCKTQLSRKGIDAVMNVLQKVRTHVNSIVNVMSHSKKNSLKAMDKYATSVSVEYTFERMPDENMTDIEIMTKSLSFEDSANRLSSTAASTSDDTWKYSTEMKSSLKEIAPSGDDESKPSLTAGAQTTTKVEVPVAPPRRRRTVSAEPEVTETPSRPPRKKKTDMKTRDLSLDSRRIPAATQDTKMSAAIGPSYVHSKDTTPPRPSNKPKRSFAGDTFDLLKNLSCMRAQKSQAENLENSLLQELSQMAVSQHDEKEIVPENEWDQSEMTESLKRGTKGALVQHGSDAEVEAEPLSLYETAKTSLDDKSNLKQNFEVEEVLPTRSEEEVEASYAVSSLSAAYILLSEATAALETPLASVAAMSGNVWTEDGPSSVQLTCEESDYATDTDTSALLKGTVQFFSRHSPRDVTPQSISSLSVSQRNSKIMPDLSEQDELPSDEVTVDVELHNVDVSKKGESEMVYLSKSLVSNTEGKVEEGHIKAFNADTISTEKESVSDDTVHLVLEEALLSQMASSEWTDDSGRLSPLSRAGMRETDILSDDSIVTEIDRSVIDSIAESFNFIRAQAKKALVAIVYPDVRHFVEARIADDTFDVEIHQEPESLALVIRVVEDQVKFTSLTVMDFTTEQSDAQRAYDDMEDASSAEDTNGETRTGITVSIVARSLHDGIYASLEEIPWGEVEMTLPECENMSKSIEDESKTSIQFNVTVSESNPEDRKSMRSQASLTQSQNTISEADHTLSTGSINIPSYVIKLGSTATITCELNNYLPPNSRIEWHKGTSQLETCPGKLDRISHDLLEVLIINNVQMDDNELYSLKINDDVFPVAYLIVESPSSEDFTATILTPPQTQFVMEGQPTVLMCQVSDPNQDVVWLKDRKPLKQSSRLHMDNLGDGWSRVVFPQTRMSDQGTYFAFLGEKSVAITLVVEERIDEKEVTVVASGTESEDDDVQEYLMPPGSTATIACELEDGDHVHSLVWLKNGQRIMFTNPNKMEHVVNGLKHYLVIHDTSTKDNGLYSVSISNTEFRVAHLAVNDLATVSQNLRRKRISNSSLQ